MGLLDGLDETMLAHWALRDGLLGLAPAWPTLERHLARPNTRLF